MSFDPEPSTAAGSDGPTVVWTEFGGRRHRWVRVNRFSVNIGAVLLEISTPAEISPTKIAASEVPSAKVSATRIGTAEISAAGAVAGIEISAARLKIFTGSVIRIAERIVSSAEAAAMAERFGTPEHRVIEVIPGDCAEQSRHEAAEHSAASTPAVSWAASVSAAYGMPPHHAAEQRTDQANAQKDRADDQNPAQPANALSFGSRLIVDVSATVSSARGNMRSGLGMQFRLERLAQVVDAALQRLVILFVAEARHEFVSQFTPLLRAEPLILRLPIDGNLHVPGMPRDQDEDSLHMLRRRPVARPFLEISAAVCRIHFGDFVSPSAWNRLERLDAHFFAISFMQFRQLRIGFLECRRTEECGIIANLARLRRKAGAGQNCAEYAHQQHIS